MNYLLHGFDERLKSSGTIPCDNPVLLKHFNEIGFGVFHSVNELSGSIRRGLNLKKITTLYVDIDSEKKEEITRKLQLVLEPSRLIETKRGYHIYYYLDCDLIDTFENEGGTKEDAISYFSVILSERLFPFFKADQRVKDAARVLRTPGYYYWKDYDKGEEPFLIKEISHSGIRYSLEDIFTQFSKKESEKSRLIKLNNVLENDLEKVAKVISDSIFSKVNDINAKEFLTEISGKCSITENEKYSFFVNSSGHQIHINGKPTGQWVDKVGKLGGGSLTNTNWLKWYLEKNRMDKKTIWKTIYAFLAETFPELK